MDNITKEVVESVRKASLDAATEVSNKIKAIIQEYEKSTGLRITGIEVHHSNGNMYGSSEPSLCSLVNLRVNL